MEKYSQEEEVKVEGKCGFYKVLLTKVGDCSCHVFLLVLSIQVIINK